jgi:DNA-binding transcriptional LysR family regulator
MSAPATPLLELDLLKTLVAISETGSFSAAASAVHRSPSAISMQVKRLEEIVGKPVFIRDSRSVELTSEGEQLLVHARRVLDLNREMVSRFASPAIAGTVRLGAFDHSVEQFVPGLLRRFSESHPGVTVDVMVENSEVLMDKIRRQELDLAIVTCSFGVQADRNIEILKREPLVWAGARGGIAVERTPLPVSVWEKGCAWREAALSALERQGREYRINFKSAYISGQKAAVLADLVVAPLPVSACGGEITILGEESGLPPLGDYSLGMALPAECTEPIDALACHLRQEFCATWECEEGRPPVADLQTQALASSF